VVFFSASDTQGECDYVCIFEIIEAKFSTGQAKTASILRNLTFCGESKITQTLHGKFIVYRLKMRLINEGISTPRRPGIEAAGY
jgi:hypothetical protein